MVVSAEDPFAYIAAIAARPAYTARFPPDLVQPGLRIPITADEALFAEVAALGREVVWLHTFGERFADPGEGRPGLCGCQRGESVRAGGGRDPVRHGVDAGDDPP